MKGNVGRLAAILLTSPLFYVPLVVAVVIKMLSRTGWGSTLIVLPFAVVPIVCGLWYFELGVRRRAARSSDLVRPGMIERELATLVLSYACFLCAEIVIVSAFSWPVGAVLLLAMLVWSAVWTPPFMRRIVLRAAVRVRCTPHDAFVVVSDPNRWPAYIPNYTVATPVEVPLHVGSEFHVSNRGSRVGVDAVERVIVFEPDARFGTELPENTRSATGVVELKAVETGTEIVYTFRSTISLPSALLGGVFRRKQMLARMAENRRVIHERLKRLLEGEPGANV